MNLPRRSVVSRPPADLFSHWSLVIFDSSFSSRRPDARFFSGAVPFLTLSLPQLCPICISAFRVSVFQFSAQLLNKARAPPHKLIRRRLLRSPVRTLLLLDGVHGHPPQNPGYRRRAVGYAFPQVCL